jgi:hypothetical protein
MFALTILLHRYHYEPELNSVTIHVPHGPLLSRRNPRFPRTTTVTHVWRCHTIRAPFAHPLLEDNIIILLTLQMMVLNINEVATGILPPQWMFQVGR